MIRLRSPEPGEDSRRIDCPRLDGLKLRDTVAHCVPTRTIASGADAVVY